MTEQVMPSNNDYHTLSDETIISAIQLDSQPHFRELVKRYLDRVWRVAFRILEDAAEAEDVTQECFVTLWQKRAEITVEKGQLGSWLYKVAFNRALDVKRVRRRHPQVELEQDAFSSPDESSDQRIASRQHQQLVWKEMTKLPENQMHALVLYYFEDMPVADISQRLGTSELGVRSLLKRGKQGLRNTLAQELLTEGWLHER
jgi:RNA polymerase sigma-70 factor (ECF subfamily)